MTTKITSVELIGGSTTDMALPSSDNSLAITNTAWIQALLAQGTQSGNGWLLIGPFMIQWGTAGGLNDNTPTTVNFNTAFPNSCFGVVATENGAHATSGNPRSMGTTVLSATQCTIEASGSGSSAFWIAIGH